MEELCGKTRGLQSRGDPEATHNWGARCSISFIEKLGNLRPRAENQLTQGCLVLHQPNLDRGGGGGGGGGTEGLGLEIEAYRGTWVAQSVERPTSAQVMISQFMGFEPHIGLCADSSEPGACIRFCVSLSLCPSPAHALSLSQK